MTFFDPYIVFHGHKTCDQCHKSYPVRKTLVLCYTTILDHIGFYGVHLYQSNRILRYELKLHVHIREWAQKELNLHIAKYTNFDEFWKALDRCIQLNFFNSVPKFRIQNNTEQGHWVTVTHQRVIPKLFYGMKVRDTYETVHALSICVNLILNDSDKRLSLNKKLNLLIWSSTKKPKPKSSVTTCSTRAMYCGYDLIKYSSRIEKHTEMMVHSS